MQNAEFAQYGNNLIIQLASGKLLIIKDYFIKTSDASISLVTHKHSEPEIGSPFVETNSLGLPVELTFQEEVPPTLTDVMSTNLMPEALSAGQAANTLFVMDAAIFSDLINDFGLASIVPAPTASLTETFESLDALLEQPIELSSIDTDFLAEILNIEGDIQLLENELLELDNAITSDFLEPLSVVSNAPESGDVPVSEEGLSTPELFAFSVPVTIGSTSDESDGVPINYTPPPENLARLSDSLGSIGANQASLNSINGTTGTAYSTSDVNGINGNGSSDGVLGSLGSGLSSDGISGALGAAAPTALAPPSDSFAGLATLPTGAEHIINFDGQLNLSFKDMHWDVLTHLNGSSLFGDTYTEIHFYAYTAPVSSPQDLLVFSDANDFIHSYSATGGLTTSGGSPVTFSYAKLTGFTDVAASTILTLNYTLAGAQSIVIDVSAATDGQGVVDIINAQLGVTTFASDATISGADAFDFSDGSGAAGNHIGFKAVWDGASIGIANYNNVTLDNVTLAGAGGSSSIGSYSDSSSVLTFYMDGSEHLAVNDGFYYQPNHLHPLQDYIVYNTNISRYSIVGDSFIDEKYAVSGANNSDFVSIDTGEYDTDTLSFYLPGGDLSLPGDPNAATVPTGFGDGDGDYDLMTNTAYTKINNIEILEARHYGTNNVVLNEEALKSVAEEMKWVDFNSNGVVDGGESFFDAGDHSQHWTLTVAGDAADTVTLTDESVWLYQGIIDIAAHTIDNWTYDYGDSTWKTFAQYNIDNGDNLSPLTKDIDSTRDAYGNILYQFKGTNGGDSYYLNISADILNHPDWYYAGTAGNDALELPDTQFGSVDLGAGIDTLELHSGLVAKTQNFTGEGGDLANVEIINTTNTYREVDGNNVHTGNTPVSVDTITVDKTFVKAATDGNDTLSLIGDNADSVTVSDIQSLWNYMGQINSSTSGTNDLTDYTFQQYKAEDGTTLNVELEMADNIGTYYNGFAGDFAITPVSTTFDGIDGGTGTDSLGFNSATQNYTNASITINTIRNIEVIEGNTHAGVTTFTINETVVDTITDSDNILSILGEAGVDIVSLSDASQWSFAGLETGLGGQSLYQYKTTEQNDGSVLNVQVNLASTPGVFFNPGLNSGVDNVSDKFTALDLNFTSLNGGGGVNDWLLVSSDNYNFTTAGVAAKITELEVIDARGDSGVNTVTLNLTSVAAMSNAQNTITVMGDANDAVLLSDLSNNTSSSWSYLGHVDGLNDFVGLKFFQYRSTDGSNTTVNLWDGINNQPDIVMLGDLAGTGIIHNSFQVENTNYTYIDGLTGTDTLQMVTAGNFDFSALGSQTVNIEVLSIEGVASGLTLSADFAEAATQNNTLVALGDSGDSLALSDAANWTYAGYVSAANPWPNFHVYRGDDAGTEVLLYADAEFGAPIVDATGTSNNDSFIFLDKNDANVDGGAGFDSLTLLSSVGNEIDLSSGKTVSNIELLDVSNGSTDNVTFNLSTVNSTTNNTMYIKGDAGQDSVQTAAGESWVLTGRGEFSDAPDMYLYQNAGSSLYVQSDLVQSLFQTPVGTSSDDILTTLESQFGSINGGGGFDRLRFVQEGSIDISDAGNNLSSIEVLDLSNNQANTLLLDTSSVAQMSGDNTVYVLGDANDNLQLQGDWSQGQSFNVSGDLTLNSYTSLSDNQAVTVYSDSQLNTSVA